MAVDDFVDELARGVAARTVTRRSLLRAGLGLAAAAVASAFPLRALASNGNGNDDAAHFCNSVFQPGPERGKCKSDAAHGTGIFFECGPGAPPGPPPPPVLCGTHCCAPGEACCSGHCTNLSSDVTNCGVCGLACPSGQPCTNGICGCGFNQTFCGGRCVPSFCPTSQVFNPSTCQCECPPGTVPVPTSFGFSYCARACTTNSDCGFGTCDTTTEGQRVCNCGHLVFCTTCTSSASCQSGCFAVNAYCSADSGTCGVACP